MVTHKHIKLTALLAALVIALSAASALARHARTTGHRGSRSVGSRTHQRIGRSHHGGSSHRGVRHSNKFGVTTRHHGTGLHHNKGIRHQKGIRHGSKIGSHRSRLHHGTGLHHNKDIHHRGTGHRHHGHHRLHYGLGFYYYGYPYYSYGYPYYRDYGYPVGGEGPKEYDSSAAQVQQPDYEALSEVREKLEREKAEKEQSEAKAKRFIDEVAEPFAAGDYATAVSKARFAATTMPDDPVLGFVFSQSLFANGEYRRAAKVLRATLAKTDVTRQGVYFPAGLYTNQDVLTGQIAKLRSIVEVDPADADAQLVLGFQLLGLEKYDEAKQVLETAQDDYANTSAAKLLIAVTEQAESRKTNEPSPDQTTAVPEKKY